MSLSVSTLALFLFLVPGLIFRFSLYEGSPVRRPFLASGTLYSSIAVILYSTMIFTLTISILQINTYIANEIGNGIRFGIAELNDIVYIFDDHLQENRRFTIANFLINYPMRTVAMFSLVCLLAYVLARTVQRLSRQIGLIGRMMYGPIYPMLSQKGAPFLTCFVLTKVGHDKQRLMYCGYPEEICLREGNNIDHIILSDPEKFYMVFDDPVPTTTFGEARRVSRQEQSRGQMFVSGSEIENVHFESFYYADPTPSLISRIFGSHKRKVAAPK